MTIEMCSSFSLENLNTLVFVLLFNESRVLKSRDSVQCRRNENRALILEVFPEVSISINGVRLALRSPRAAAA